MVLRSYLIILFVLVANLSLPKKVLADDTCTMTLVKSGILIGERETKPTKLVTSSVGGSLGSISVTCSKEANLTVSSPVRLNGDEFDLNSSFATVKDSLNNFTDSKGASPLKLSTGTTLLTVDLVIDKGNNPLKPDKYKYRVRLNVISKE